MFVAMKKEQYFTHYKNWECWQNGMYRDISSSEKEYYISKSIECLRNPRNHMMNVIEFWKNSAREHLSDRKSNRKSWLGQAACCYAFGSPEHITRLAWCKLTIEEQNNANNIANQIIEIWENNF